MKEQDKITIDREELKNQFKAEIDRRATEAKITHHRPTDKDVIEIIVTVCPWIRDTFSSALVELVVELKKEMEYARKNEA